MIGRYHGSDHGRQPGYFDVIQLLPWQAQLTAAVVVLGMGAGSLAMFPESFGAWALLALTLAAGVPLAVHALGLRRAQRVEAEERARAEAELEELQREVAAAVARGAAIDRLLTKRGFTSAKVRRWIALECDVVLPDGVR